MRKSRNGTLAVVLLTVLFQFYTPPTHAGWFKDFCARHLIADHPYQVWARRLPTHDVVREFRQQAALVRWRRGDPDEYEMVLAVLTKRYDHATSTEREEIREAFEDYPDPRVEPTL